MKATEPKPPKRPHVLTAHGERRTDEYFWMRDDSRRDPEVIAHLEAENAWFGHAMEQGRPLQDALFGEITGRLDPNDSSVPYEKQGYWYYTRFERGGEYAIHARRRGSMDAHEEILLDGNQRAEGHAYYRLGNLEVSDDHRFAAVAEDTQSRGMHTIRILDTVTGAFLPEKIVNASSSLAWSACGNYLFYLEKHPETLLAFRVMRHRLHSNPRDDERVYEERDKTFYNSLWRSRSGQYILLVHHSTNTTETQLLDAEHPLGPFRPFLPRETGHEYEIDHANGRFFIRSNWQARNFRVLTTTSAHSSNPQAWRELIGHRDEATVLEIVAFDDWLVVAERQDGLRKVRVLSLEGPEDRYLEAAEYPGVMWPATNPTTSSRSLRFGYSSLVTPPQTWETDLATGSSILLKTERILGGFDSGHYRTGRMNFPARDGTPIPVSYVHHRRTPLDGSAPVLIYAYGAYGASTDPWFRSSMVSLLDRGFIYVIAHVRGGQEMGRTWYEQGRQRNKWNTFHDFIDATRHLQAAGLVDPKRTYAMGASAGGLLMGVVVNEAPDLYHGVIAAVPFVDVLTSMLDESIPLTTGEYDEWGNPNRPGDYAYIRSYSPYDQVSRQAYPHLMVTTGLFDPQVQYWEPAKWVARLRDRRTNRNSLIMKTNMEAGHGGASGRYQQYRETAEEFAFLIQLAFPSGTAASD